MLLIFAQKCPTHTAEVVEIAENPVTDFEPGLLLEHPRTPPHTSKWVSLPAVNTFDVNGEGGCSSRRFREDGLRGRCASPR